MDLASILYYLHENRSTRERVLKERFKYAIKKFHYLGLVWEEDIARGEHVWITKPVIDPVLARSGKRKKEVSHAKGK